MAQAKAGLIIMKGVMSDLKPEEQAKIREGVAKITAVANEVRAAGDVGQFAVAMFCVEEAARNEE